MTRVRRTTPLLAASILLLALAPLVHAQTAPSPPATLQTPDGRPLHQWNPSESWPAGAQADARLDTTVTFWRAGVTLGEVFEGIRQQTGVTLTFYPKDDENHRVRMNLFLNQSEPPTLRALMTQLT